MDALPRLVRLARGSRHRKSPAHRAQQEVRSMLLAKMAGHVAPIVCPACEDGTGLVLDRHERRLKVCEVCSGTGRSR